MESRSYYDASKLLARISEESREPARSRIAPPYTSTRQERRAQAAIERREAKKDRKKATV